MERKKEKLNKILKNLFIAIFLITFLVAVYEAGVLVGRREISFNGLKPQIIKNQENGDLDFSLFWQILRIVEEEFPGQIDYQKIIYGAINGALKSLDDPYSYFMTEEEGKMLLEDAEGKFGGIGAEIGAKDNKIQIMSVLEGTPAQRAGLLAGDVILKINDNDVVDMSLYEAVKQIRGEPKTEVKLTIQREGLKEPKDFVIVRDIINITTVKYELKENDIAYIKILQFTENTEENLKQAVEFFKDKKIKGIVLDLRDNPGGELGVTVDIASYFLNKKPVLIEKFKDGKLKRDYCKDNPVFKDEPLVVLINGGTASAAEILAAAIQDNKRGILIGEKTFGKGSVQRIERIKNGYLRLTIAYWLTPSGKSINKEGLSPDIEIKMVDQNLQDKRDLQLQKAIDYLKK